VKGFIVSTVVTAIAFFILVQLLPSMFGYEGGYLGLAVIAVVFGAVNGFVGPIVKTAALPISFMTMGLVGFLINAGLLLLTAFISGQLGFQLTVGDFPPDLFTADTIVAAIVGAVVLSLISTVIRLAVPD
jgi:putative membrane protein